MDTVRFDRPKDLRPGPLCIICGQTAARHPDLADFHRFQTEEAEITPVTTTPSPADAPVVAGVVVDDGPAG